MGNRGREPFVQPEILGMRDRELMTVWKQRPPAPGRKYPFRAYAPGGYINTCHMRDDTFLGTKRAIECED